MDFTSIHVSPFNPLVWGPSNPYFEPQKIWRRDPFDGWGLSEQLLGQAESVDCFVGSSSPFSALNKDYDSRWFSMECLLKLLKYLFVLLFDSLASKRSTYHCCLSLPLLFCFSGDGFCGTDCFCSATQIISLHLETLRWLESEMRMIHVRPRYRYSSWMGFMSILSLNIVPSWFV